MVEGAAHQGRRAASRHRDDRRPRHAGVRGPGGPAARADRRRRHRATRGPGRRARCRPSTRSAASARSRCSVPQLRSTDVDPSRGDGAAQGARVSASARPRTRCTSTRWARAAPAAELHVAVQPGLPIAEQGAGAVHHVAFRTPDDAQYDAWAERLADMRIPNSGKVDRYLFPQPVFPRAERHPVRDRDRRSGLRHRRAAGRRSARSWRCRRSWSRGARRSRRG